MDTMEQIMQDAIKNQEQDFYAKKFYFSYSSLNKLLWNPVVFYQIYIMGIREERTDKHLIEGKVIHCLLLDHGTFDQQFVVSPKTLPSGTPKQVIDMVYRTFLNDKEQYVLIKGKQPLLVDFSDEILEAMKKLNYFQNLKTDQQRLDKLVTTDNESYWNFLFKKGSKDLIDEDTLKYCSDAVDLIRTNKKVMDLLGHNVSEFDNKEVFNEIILMAELHKYPFGVKGIIDNLVIDHDSKTIFINDLKTSSKELKDFPESVEFYSYWLQASVYTGLVISNYQHLVDQGYQLKFHFVVIDKNLQTYAFPVQETTLNHWIDRTAEVFEKANHHYETKSYELPYEFDKGLVTL